MHIIDWKEKAVSGGETEYEIKYDYEYVYDTDGYLTESKRTKTNILYPEAKPVVTKTLYFIRITNETKSYNSKL